MNVKFSPYESATVVSDCMNFFHFLPVSHQIDIRVAKLLENSIYTQLVQTTTIHGFV